MKIRTTAMGVVLASLSLALIATPAVQAQTRSVPSRVTAAVDDTRTVQLKGNVHPWRARNLTAAQLPIRSR